MATQSIRAVTRPGLVALIVPHTHTHTESFIIFIISYEVEQTLLFQTISFSQFTPDLHKV